jgi:hypothetical protein
VLPPKDEVPAAGSPSGGRWGKSVAVGSSADEGLALGYHREPMLSTYQAANASFLSSRGKGPTDLEIRLEEVARKKLGTDPATGQKLDAATLVKSSRVELGTEPACDYSTTNFMAHPGVQPRTQAYDPKAYTGMFTPGESVSSLGSTADGAPRPFDRNAPLDAVVLGYDPRDLRTAAMDHMQTQAPRLKQVYVPVLQHQKYVTEHPALDTQAEMLAQGLLARPVLDRNAPKASAPGPFPERTGRGVGLIIGGTSRQ